MMPNNLQILSYIQAMKDHIIENIKRIESHEPHGRTPNSHSHKAHLQDLINLEKFIKGGK